MPDRLSFHTPVLVNTIGHFAGAVAFGILLYLLVIDWRRNPRERGSLPSIAAALALLWNLGSLVGLATAPQGGDISDTIVAASFSVLSLLPAVLLHISLGPRRPVLWVTGYAVSGLAIALHIGDLVTAAPRFHYAGLLLITIGFGALTAFSVVRETIAGGEKSSGARLAGAMVLFLFAISFVHFGAAHDARAWSGEAILHHAGIPLALFVLLQDYRFLLLDAFIRFLVNGLLAALAAWATLQVEARFGILAHAAREPFYFGLAFSLACLGLSLFAWTRARVQRLLTRAVFLRVHWDHAVSKLRDLAQTDSDRAGVSGGGSEVDGGISVRAASLQSSPTPATTMPAGEPTRLSTRNSWNLPNWVQALVPLRFSRGDVQLLLLGSRFGGRRYLSEDLEILERFARDHLRAGRENQKLRDAVAGRTGGTSLASGADQPALPVQRSEYALRDDREREFRRAPPGLESGEPFPLLFFRESRNDPRRGRVNDRPRLSRDRRTAAGPESW